MMYNILIYLSLLIPSQSDFLDQYQWENRLLLIYPGSNKQDLVNQQIRKIADTDSDFIDRDMVYIVLNDDPFASDGQKLTSKDYQQLINKYDLQNEYTVILIGKDGGVKHSESNIVDMEKIYALIDRMPMRRNEMRRRN